jgi:aspartyl-tRNA(Asn)/glutamyl-tRNA(Gln) amidotransferase subunit C
MALNTEEVRKIAALARLGFKPEEEAVLVGQLGRIVDYVDQLQRYEIAETGPDAEAREAAPEAAPEAALEADDRVQACLPREQFLANAPAALDGFLLVPMVPVGKHA